MGILLLLIGIGINRVVSTPEHWGSIQMNTKLKFLKEKNFDYKIYFIGSSVTFRHVIPSVLNKALGEESNYAFNLGADGTLPPETFHVMDYLLEADKTVDYIFFEINSFHHLPEHVFIPTKTKYYFHIKDLLLSYKYFLSSNLVWFKKLGMAGKYTILYLENLFKVGMRADYIKFINGKNVFGYDLLGKKQDGYLTLPNLMTKDKQIQKQMPSLLKKYKQSYEVGYTKLKENRLDDNYNQTLSTLLVEQIKKAEAKGVTVIFILNPINHVFDKAEEMVALLQSLPEKNRIDLANPYKYSDLYKVENRWDEGHLNSKGAQLYTQELANQFEAIRKNK